jgi:hypothetical protein
MAEKMIENNRVSVIGEIVSEFSFSHEVFGEGFYMVDLSVNRLSEQADVIPLMVSERLMDVHKDLRGSTIEAVGQFRSYNRHEGVKNRLMLSVFAREIRFLDEFTDYTRTNQIFLDGYICKPPIYRKTPLGREIADLLLAVDVTCSNEELRGMKTDTSVGKGAALKVMDHFMIVCQEVIEWLKMTASENGIPYQLDISDHGGTDACKAQRYQGVKAGAVCVPAKNIHSGNEIVSKSDVAACLELIQAISDTEINF